MQIRKKYLLGFGGLALVTAITAYAVTIPTNDAGASSASGEVQLTVKVYGEDPNIRITTIEDGEVTLDGNITIGTTYAVADSLEYNLCKNFGTAEQYCANLGANATYVPAVVPESGDHSFDFDLDSDPNLGFGEYTLQAINHAVEDTVSFKYVPLHITTMEPAQNGDPVVNVEYADKVSSFDLQAYDKDNKPLFDTPMNVKVDNPGVAGEQQVTLPFGSYGAASGEYTVVAFGRGMDGAVIESQKVSTKVDYTAPDAPEVPKTGSFFGDLNIGRMDYLITGLIMFAIATAFAVRALKKRSSKR